MTEMARPRIFLSHNSRDKEYVRKVAAVLAVTGAYVWFDEWTIQPGDSIPGAVEQGLANFDIFVLIWSDAASKSPWVRSEMEAAFMRRLADESLRLVPLMLDTTPLPSLLSSRRWLDGTDGDHVRAGRELLGLQSEYDFRRAVQGFINEAGLTFREFWGVGVVVGCLKCGADSSKLRGWHSSSEHRDEEYAGAECTECGWSDGSET